MTQPLLQAADLRSTAGRTHDAWAGLASLVEAMHKSSVALPRMPGLGVAGAGERPGGANGLAFETARGITRLTGGSVDALWAWLALALTTSAVYQPLRPEREAILAALNGVLGDHLATTDSPLAITMQFRRSGQPLPLERHALRSRFVGATEKLLVLVHGSCLNDLQWHRGGHDHGEALARELGYTPVYLHYNSGLSVSTNGRILASLMEALYSAWPVAVQRLVVVGHGMGGLVARSAIHHGAHMQRGELRWPGRVDDLVCLGTPHLGTALERAGHGMDLLLGAAPYAAPLARLGKVRSAGINDLRRGSILKSHADDDALRDADRVNLPDRARCFAIAASLDPASASRRASPPGDGLVPVASALGQHREPELSLGFEAGRQAVVHDTGHLDLLSSTEVYARLRQWLD